MADNTLMDSSLTEDRPSRFAQLLDRSCRLLATAGGLVLVGFALMTVVSVTRRYLFGEPIYGDFEMVEVGCAISVFAFLPYCQLHRGNVVVDFFTLRSPARLRAMLDAMGSLIYAAIAGLLTWRLTLGGYDMWRYGEETMVLGLSRWWGFIPIVAATLLLCLVCLYTTWRSLQQNRMPTVTGGDYYGG